MDAGSTLRDAESVSAATTVRRPSILAVRVRPRTLVVGLLSIPLLICSGVTLVACFLSLSLPQQLDEGEPLIYGLADRIRHFQPLYQPIDQQPFIQVHYTPLYYFAVAALRLFGPGFAPGRVLSIIAGFVAAGLVGYMTCTQSNNRWMALFAAMMFLGLGFPGGPAPFMALVRVDMLGAALSIAAIAILLHGTARGHLVAAAVCAGLAPLTKQSLFAAALAGSLWLFTFDRRKAAVFAGTTAAVVVIPALILQWSSGGAFWHNIGPDNPSPTSLAFGAYLFHELAVTLGIPALLALTFVIATRAWKRTTPRLLLFYWLSTAIPIVGIVKLGANRNYWLEFAAATAVLASLAIWTCLAPRRRSLRSFASLLPVLLLAVQLAILAPARLVTDRSFDTIPYSWVLSRELFGRLAFQTSGFDNLVNALRKEPGPVLAENVDVAVLSDHPVLFEPFAFSMLERQGRWNSGPLVDDICSGRIALLVLTYTIDSNNSPVGMQDYPMWPRSVMAALRSVMQLADTRDWHFLYRPIDPLDAATTTQCEASAAAAR
jgi:hypothetical protein